MAGQPGSSKSPLAYYLSWKNGLPIFSNDAIRKEVMEDSLQPGWDNDEYQERRKERLNEVLGSNKSFIYDAGIERRWEELKPELEKAGYAWFVISFNLSQERLQKMRAVVGFNESQETVERWAREYKNFSNQYKDDIGLVIDDNNFAKRMELAHQKAQEFLRSS